METEEYNDTCIVRFLESKGDKQRSGPRGVEESKDKEAKRAYRQKCESFNSLPMTVFCSNLKGAKNLKLEHWRLHGLPVRACGKSPRMNDTGW